MPREVEIEAPYLDQLLDNRRLLKQMLAALHAGTEIDIVIEELLGGEKYGFTLRRCDDNVCAYIYAASQSSINPIELEEGYGVKVAEVKLGKELEVEGVPVVVEDVYGTQNSATDEFYAVAEAEAKLPLPRSIEELADELKKLYAIYDKAVSVADEYMDKALKLVKEEQI